MEQSDPLRDETEELAARNQKRREFARRTGLPFIPVISDREVPPVDAELVRKMLDRELPSEEWNRIAGYCWTYPSWIKAMQGMERGRYEALRRRLLEESEPPPEL